MKKITFPKPSMAIFKSHDYVQVSNFPYLGQLRAGACFLREETANGVKWTESDGDRTFDEVTDKNALKRLEKLWDERNYNGF